MKVKLSDKAKDVIRTVAPTLGAALGGPLGGLAGNLISAAIGGENIEKAVLQQSPETLLALRKAEQDFELKLEELGVDRERIAMQDRASARELFKIDMRPQLYISTLFLGGYFLILALRMFGILEVAKEEVETLNALFSVLTTGVPLILMFWFGSTAGSAAKNRLLANSKPDVQ